MKRVWCLYRVSTKKQVNVEDDIPMQRTACHEFAENNKDWEITNELYEKGVSGWSKKTDDRDALVSIKKSAIEKEFDILLVFMLDRLGRNLEETPLVVSFLKQCNIDVWSVKEGKRSVESHVDKLITYLGFWASSGESLKTSIRVVESKKQLSEQGYYQGGVANYGYKIIETDQKHWKNKDKYLKEIVTDEYESEIVELIFDLYVNSHCGYRKIVDKLNSKGYKSRDGKPFRTNTIQRAITNPIVIGLKKYKSQDSEIETMPYNEKLRIISDDLFYQAEKIRTKRHLTEQNKEGIPMSGKLLFSGLARCSFCGGKLTGSYLYRKDIKNKKEYRNIIYRYICPLNKGSFAEKHEKNMWGGKKFDKIGIEQIKIMLSLIDISQFIDENVNKKQKHVNIKRQTVSNLEKDKLNFHKQLEKLNTEIAESLIGNSSFTPDQLSTAINGINIKLETVDGQIAKLKNEIRVEDNNFSDINNLAQEIDNWEEKFDNADGDLKKAMVSRLISKVEFYKDDLKIYYVAQISELMGV